VEDGARHAAEAIRDGGGPHFLELRTYRFRAHSMYDPDRYRDKSEVDRWKRLDPIPALVSVLHGAGLLADGAVDDLESSVAAELDDAVAFADAGTYESVETLEHHVTSEPSPETT
jgi:pyruvate dehydrogenase E1 component subunit alpha